MKRGFFFAVLFLGLGTLRLFAEEGMWMPQQIPQLAPQLKTLGFAGDPAAFANLTGQPMGAVVSLGGCTASFVSPDGLIVTNHHCAVGALQYNSTPQRNLLTEGFLAKTRDQELPNAPGSRVFVTTSVTDVTSQIVGSMEASLDDKQRAELIERRSKKRVAQCEKSNDRCSVASFFGGLQYFEIAQMEIKDVRLVYAPAEGIGVFGGETDNWRWPRHTGDWSFLRAYVGKDGKPAPFSKDNVPFHPAHWLKVSTAGITPGSLVFVAGYPGRTQRFLTYEEVKEITEWTYPRAIRLRVEQLALIDRLTKENKGLEITLANRIQSLNNGLTDLRGILEGLVKGGALQKKQLQEKELIAWIAADPARQKKYGGVLPAMAALQAEENKTRERDATLASVYAASTYLGAAQVLYKLSAERPLPDLEREPGYQQRDWPRIKEAQERIQRAMDAGADRALLGWALGLAAALPAEQRIQPLDQAIGLKAGMAASESTPAINNFLDKLYAGTKIGDEDFRLSLLEKKQAELDGVNDALISLARQLFPLDKALREQEKRMTGAYSRLRPVYMEAMLAQRGGLLAPDANSTLRVTFGTVKGVKPRDGLFYEPQTTLAGVVEKNRGEGDFNAPAAQLKAIQALRDGKQTPYFDKALKDVPVNFLSTVDTTGGNSGSPTLNDKGELVGLLFDGTYESVSSDFLFDAVKTRSIHVDIRYMLWNMQEVDGASNLLQEMGIGK